MGLRNVIQNAVVTAQNALGDLFQTATYGVAGHPDYNPETGENDAVFTTTFTVQLLFSSFTFAERQINLVEREDKKALIARKPIPALDPQPGDLIRAADGEVWQVVTIMTDPADALWTLHIRRYLGGWPS